MKVKSMKYLKKFENTEEYSYWEINFTSCEGNKRWVIARTPIDWDEWDVRNRIRTGGCGDDPAEIGDISQTWDDDYGWDFT